MTSMKVLLVDDEMELIQTLAERLALRDIEAEVATDRKGALELVEAKEFNVVILDMVLQRVKGTEVLKDIKKVRPELPVILVSGRGSDEDFREVKSMGAFDYLIKPVAIDALIEKMKEAVKA